MAALICPRGHDEPGEGTTCIHCGEFLRKAPAGGAAAGVPEEESPCPRPPRASAMVICTEEGCGIELDHGVCPFGHPRPDHDRAPEQEATVPHAQERGGPGRGPRAGTGPGGGATTSLSVVFPFGTYPVGSTPLVVGRSVTEAGELAERLDEYARWSGNDYGNVSRVHAIAWSDNDGTWIRHVSRTNATCVNNTPLPLDEPHRLHPGDVLAFAARLRAHVEVSAEDY